ncbi:MAG: hypothetical protein K2P81_05235 [Bacteriovoracaceae bacterium]|nr:hypothetical protein [Bacteriovoracaceae bacterium]
MNFLILILLLPFTAQAQWPDKVLAVIATQTPLARHIENPAVATFWGGI